MTKKNTPISKKRLGIGLALFFLLTVSRMYSQIDYGTPGMEVEHVSIKFSDIVAYDAAHPVGTNQKFDLPEPEYSHGDFIRDHIKQANKPKSAPQSLAPSVSQVMTASPAPSVDFNGITDNGNFIPPDTYGAVGPNHVMTTVNSQVRITDRTGATQYSIVTLSNFWAAAFAVSTVVCDPKITYDPYSNRWIFISLNGTTSTTSSICIGVTQTNDPTGVWNMYKVMVNVVGDWMDFPNLGFNKNWIVVSGNLFTNTTNTFVAAKVWAFNKANLYNNVSASNVAFSNLPNDFCLCPTYTYDNNLNDLFLMESYDGSVGQVRLFKVSGTPTVPTFSTAGTATSSFLWNWGFATTNTGPQVGTTNKIDCGDDRLATCCYRNGSLWAAHNSFLPVTNSTRCSAHWMQMDTLGNYTQNSVIDDATGANFYVYPSIAVNANNDALIGYTNMSASIHPSSGYSYRAHGDAVNTFQTPYIYKSGINTYYKTFSGTSCRWGDYSRTMVDPVNDVDFWTVQEYSESAVNTWGTWWAKVSGCAAPIQPGSIAGSSSVCRSSTQTYSIAAVSGATGYTWVVPSGSTITSGQNTISIIVSMGTTSGSISVLASNACGNSPTQSINVTVNPLPSATITAGGNTTFCQGGSVTLTASSGSSYSWSNGATTQAITVNSSGGYSVIVTNANGCSATSSATTITVNPLPTATITAGGNTTFCQGGSVTLTASSGSSYSWSNGATTQAITVNSSGSYSVVVTNANGCSATSSATTITVNPLPTATITAGGNTTFCQGGSVTLTASAGSSYSWSNGVTTQAITVNSSGSYSVVVTNANGCSATSSATTVTVNPLPTATITAGGNTTFCQGGSVTLTASSGSSYSWSTGATTQAITVNSSGSYSVVVTNANGCSATSSATTITVNPLPTATITAGGNTTFCQGGSVTLTASSGSSYSWSNGTTTQAITVNLSGSYSVVVTNSNGCSATSSATTITVNPLPTATITAGGNTTFCQGGSVTLTASAGGTYSWSNGATTQAITVNSSGSYSVIVTNANGCSATSSATTVTVNPAAVPVISGPSTVCGTIQITLSVGTFSTYVWSTGATTSSITVNSANTYRVTVTNSSGCTGTASKVITQGSIAAPTITASGATSFCTGGSVTLSTGAFATYVWSNGATTSAITVSAPATYIVTVTNVSGCTGSASKVVNNYATPVPMISITNMNTFCAGGSATLTVTAIFPSYIWNTGATTRPITVNTSGTYRVTVTNTNGCTASVSATLSNACNTPASLSTTSILGTSASANWVQPTCYYGYSIRRSLHNANVWTTFVITPNTHYTFSGLALNTTYDWQIRTNCNAAQTNVSAWSAIQTFTTLPQKFADEPAFDNTNFSIVPNPAKDVATILFFSEKEENYTLSLVDIEGKVVFSTSSNASLGDNQYLMNISQFAKGVYIVMLQKGDAIMRTKMVVQ